MQLQTSYVQKCKVAAHVLQGLLIFIAACITISILTKDGTNSGSTKWFFALCFLSIPALIYLTMVPMWSTAAKFANVWAFIAIDSVYTIFWFSAFIAVQVYITKNISSGEDKAAKHKDQPKGKNLDPPTGCDAFDTGEPARCTLSKATVGFGVVIFILWVLSSAISLYALKQYRKDGTLIYMGDSSSGAHRPLNDHDGVDDATGHQLGPHKDVWSADTGDVEHGGAYGPPGRTGGAPYGGEGEYNSDDDHYDDAPYHSQHEPLDTTQSQSYGAHPGRPVVDWDGDTSYGGAHGPNQGYQDPGHRPVSPDNYEANSSWR